MEITFLLSNLTESFYNKIDSMTNIEIYKYLTDRNIFNMKPTINKNSTIRDCIDFNKKMKAGCELTNKRITIRRGYRLLTFDI